MNRAFGPLDRYALLFLGILIAFIGYKLQFLGLPYYWDEAWVYAPAIQEMYKNGLSLLPDAIDTRFSRGHPLMFHFLGAVWMNVFGESQVAMHSYVLTISSLLVVLTYVVGSQVASKPVGLVAASWLVLSEKFLAQSGIILPEVLLALFSLATIWAYLRQHRWLYVLFGTCALLTKESAVVVVLAILLWHVVHGLIDDPKIHVRKFWKEILIIVLPILLIACYFFYQYHLFGWFFFPLHTDLIELDAGRIYFHLGLAISDIFVPHGILWITPFLMLVCPLFLANRRLPIKYAVILIASFLFSVQFMPDKELAVEQPEGMWILMLVAPLPFVYFAWSAYCMNWTWARFAFLGIIFIFLFFFFSSMNFFANRYLVCLIPLSAILFAAILQESFKYYAKWMFPVASIGILVALFLGIGNTDGVGDCELSYADSIRVNEQVIAFLEKEAMYDELIYAHFVPMQYMTHPYIGYLKHDKPFTRIQVKPEKSRYAMFTSDLLDEYYDQLRADGWITIAEFDEGLVHGEILENPNEPEEADTE